MTKTSRDDLLAIAFRLFLTRGYEQTSMQDLARESGLSKGAFHHYFPRKHDLFEACIERFFHEFLPATAPSPDEDVRHVAREAARQYAEALVMMREHGIPLAAYQVFLWSQVRDNSELFERRCVAFLSSLASGIERQHPQRCGQGTRLARSFAAHVEGTGVLLCLGPEPSADAIRAAFEQCVEAFVTALGAGELQAEGVGR